MGTSKKPKIAVALAVYNGIKWLPEQMESILNQKQVNVEVFISIDPSTDGSEEWCIEKVKEDSRIHLLPNAGRFGGAAPNFFRLLKDIDITNFDHLAFADQDDIWLPNKLSRAVEVLGQTKASGYSSNFTAFWESGRRVLINKAQPQRKWDFLFESAGPGCTYVMTKQLTKNLQVFIRQNWDTMQAVSGHDWFSYAYARTNDFKWYIDAESHLLYRQHSNNQTGVNLGWRAFKFRWNRVVSGWAIEQAALTAEILGLNNDNFVKLWSKKQKIGILKLAFCTPNCRRKFQDRIYFFFACFVMLFFMRDKLNFPHRINQE